MRQNLTAEDQTDTTAETRQLRGYQVEAVDAAVEALTTADRTSVVMACGTGKTITSLRLLEKLVEDDQAPIAIVALPSLGLLGQTLAEWSRDAVRGFSAAAVCSDDEVAYSPEAREIVVPVTTNSDDLGEWFATTAGPRIIYTTYQSSPVVARALKERGEVADVLIADEAHRTASRDDATFATLLDDSRAPIRSRVYLTATPRVHTSNADDDLLLSMDDVEIYGDRAYTYSFAQAVEDDVLSDYQVAVVAMTNEEAKSLSSGTSPAQLQSTAAQAALVRAALDYDVHRAFVYSASVARSEDFAQGLPHVIDAMGGLERDRVTVGHLDSSTPLSHRRAMLGALAAADEDYVFLSNCRVLGEGVDAPALDAVVFADPKTSSIEIVQTVGRAMRKNPRREGPALIVLPVIVGDTDDPDEALAESNFRHVWSTVRALIDMDPRFEAEMRAADPISRTRGGGSIAHSLSFIGAGGELRAEMVRSLQLRTVEVRGGVSPELGLSRLEESDFFQTHGHINVHTRDYAIGGWNAGRWLETLRLKYRKDQLAHEVVLRAEMLGINWNPNPMASGRTSRDERLDQLGRSEFYREYGHINVPRDYEIEGWKAGQWLGSFKAKFKRGKLRSEEIERAEWLGIVWPKSAHYVSLDDGLDRLERSRFYEERGHINLPGSHEIDGWKAGAWVGSLRTKYRRGELSGAVVERAEGLGLVWALKTSGVAANEGLDRLERSRFYEERGHINLPGSHEIDGWKAGAWIGTLRKKYRKGVLSNETVARAESLGIDWSPRSGG